jgi:hypothetical protein
MDGRPGSLRGSFTILANYHLNATHPTARYLTAWLRWFVDLGRGKCRERQRRGEEDGSAPMCSQDQGYTFKRVERGIPDDPWECRLVGGS